MIMTALLVGILLVAADPEVASQPAAMVLTAKGSIVVQRGGKELPVAVMDLLQPGDIVRVKTGGSAKIVILGDGHREEIPAGAEVKLAPEGCQPPDAVTKEASKLSAAQLTNLRKMAQSQRGGVVVIRSANTSAVKATKRGPLNGTTILTERPTFAWEEVADVLDYRIELFLAPMGKPERLVWKKDLRETKLEFPKDEKALLPGTRYRWQVTALLGGDQESVVVNARFMAPTEDLPQQVKELTAMAKSEDPSEWLLAATTLESLGVYEAALPIFEQLAEKFPQEARYQEALVEYYQRAGDADKAKAAGDKAKKLRS